jgi:thiosulfate reductase/polysulfide reductase chain A
MMNVIVGENLYDSDFIKSSTVGFDEFQDGLVAYPPEWAEKVCDVPKETIYRIAREIAAKKPGALVHRGYHGAYGAGYLNSFQTARAVALLNALLGNMGAKGGLYMPHRPVLGSLKDGGHPSPGIPTVQKADGSGIPGRYPAGSYSDGITHAVPELALAGELKAGFVYHSNPARTNPNPARVIAGYRNLDLLVVIDCFMSETASMAHYVLPESFFLERDDMVDTVHSSGIGQLTLVRQVIKPLHDTKPLLDILKGLSTGLGIERFFNFTIDEVNRLYLKPLNIDLETLKRDGVADVGEHWTEGFKPLETPSGKVEFYSKRLKDWDVDPFPVWQEPLTAVDPNDPHSFRLLHGKQAVQTNSMTSSSPVLNNLAVREKMTRLLINRARAEKLDIADGDRVFIESEMCRGEIAVRLTDGLHPDAVWLPSGYGGFSKHLTNAYGLGLSYNDFCPTRFDPVVGHAMTSEIIVSILKADG